VLDQDLPAVDRGLTVGISVSESEDLQWFGVTETHVRMALAEVARAVLIAEGRLVYAGHLEEEGYTAFLTKEIQRFGRRNRPLTGYIPFAVHRQMATRDIEARIAELGLLGRYEFLGPDGETIDPIDGRSGEPELVDRETEKLSLTMARQIIAANVDGQVVLGGKRAGFRGRMPGVIEETILTMRARKPVFMAGGFGGAAGDMAVALGLDPEKWLRLDEPSNPYLAELQVAAKEVGWVASNNGLNEDENHRLAITYRASEVAYLIVTGLSRLSRTS
jgi:SLOG-like protein